MIGFDDIVDASLADPPLTSIAAPLASIGSSGIAHLLRRRRHGPGEAGPPVLLPARLVLRRSTGPLARRSAAGRVSSSR